MVVAFILEVYDAVISQEQFQTILFLTFSILSLVSFFLLKNKVESLKLKLLKKPD
jgi:ABC-type protease/lipase transport system fused ATPase/permease subunit